MSSSLLIVDSTLGGQRTRRVRLFKNYCTVKRKGPLRGASALVAQHGTYIGVQLGGGGTHVGDSNRFPQLGSPSLDVSLASSTVANCTGVVVV